MGDSLWGLSAKVVDNSQSATYRPTLGFGLDLGRSLLRRLGRGLCGSFGRYHLGLGCGGGNLAMRSRSFRGYFNIEPGGNALAQVHGGSIGACPVDCLVQVDLTAVHADAVLRLEGISEVGSGHGAVQTVLGANAGANS